MKRFGIAIIIVLGFALMVVGASAQNRAVVVRITGKVEIQNPGEQTWNAASDGMEVPIRATISTGFDGRAVLQLGASTLTVRPLTRLRIDQLSKQNNVDLTSLSMPVGRILVEVKAATGTKNDFSVHSPTSTAAVRGTGFETDGVRLSVFDSTVAFSSQSGISTNVSAGETGVSFGGGVPSGGANQREANTAVNPYTSLTGTDGIGGGLPGHGVGTITVTWQ